MMSTIDRERKRFFEWNPGKSLLASMRSWHSSKRAAGAFGIFFSKFHALRHKFWSVIAGADIPVNCNIGPGLLIPHPNGIVVHPAAIIGSNCLVMQQVTVGTTAEGGVPFIGDHVDIGAGAKILGPVIVGDHAVIGANAVVISDVPAWYVAVGVPARLHLRKDATNVLESNG